VSQLLARDNCNALRLLERDNCSISQITADNSQLYYSRRRRLFMENLYNSADTKTGSRPSMLRVLASRRNPATIFIIEAHIAILLHQLEIFTVDLFESESEFLRYKKDLLKYITHYINGVYKNVAAHNLIKILYKVGKLDHQLYLNENFPLELLGKTCTVETFYHLSEEEHPECYVPERYALENLNPAMFATGLKYAFDVLENRNRKPPEPICGQVHHYDPETSSSELCDLPDSICAALLCVGSNPLAADIPVISRVSRAWLAKNPLVKKIVKLQMPTVHHNETYAYHIMANPAFCRDIMQPEFLRTLPFDKYQDTTFDNPALFH